MIIVLTNIIYNSVMDLIIFLIFFIIYYKLYDGKWDIIKKKFVKKNRQYVVIASVVLIFLLIFMFAGIFITKPILINARNNVGR